MFIFITPHIVKDPKEQLACLRQELLCLRPGDIPYFLECVQEAHHYEKTRLMEGSMTLLFGRPRERLLYFLMTVQLYCKDKLMENMMEDKSPQKEARHEALTVHNVLKMMHLQIWQNNWACLFTMIYLISN